MNSGKQFPIIQRFGTCLINIKCFYRIPLAFRGGLLLLLVVAILHTLDRQGEFVSRTDFLWKAKLKVEQEEVETMRGINKVMAFSYYKLFLKFKFLENIQKF